MKYKKNSFSIIFAFSFANFLCSGATAQEIQEPEVLKNYFEPRIRFQQKYTSNLNLDESKKNGHITSISPGLIWIGNSAKLKGYADYSLDYLFSSQEKEKSKVFNQASGFATLELLDERFFLDLSGSSSIQKTSAFAYLEDPYNFSKNSSKVKNYSLSPYYKGELLNNAFYELRGGFSRESNNSSLYSDKTQKFTSFNVQKSPENSKFGWAILFDRKNLEFSNQRDINNFTYKAAISYLIDNNLVITAIAGKEKTNQLSLSSESYSITGVSAKWNPSERTFLSSKFEKRYFGNSHEVLFEHRTGKTVWRYKDTNGVSDENGFSQNGKRSIFDLIDNYYFSIEKDNIKRTKLVLSELERLGLSRDEALFQDYLRSANTLEKTKELSLVLFGIRSSVTLGVFEKVNEKLGRSVFSGFDFDVNNKISQKGWNLSAAHRLTPISAVYLNITQQNNRGSALGFKSSSLAFRAGFNSQLAKKTNINLQIGRSLFEGNANKYDDSSVMGTLTYRF